MATTQVVDREAALKRQIEAQQRMLSKITTAAKFISFKGGNIIIDGKALAGAKTEVIPLAFMGERAYFPGEFDTETRQSPLCYAYSNGDEDEIMAPHKEAKEAQSKTCEECEHNVWGSAAKGRGKACRESVRVALIPAKTDPTKEAVWHCRIPITSVPAFKSYAGELLGFGKPLHSAVAELSVTPDAKTFFKIHWMPKRATDPKHMGFVETKAAAAQAAISFPYPNFDDDAPKAPVKPLKTKKR
jgi:hypothetical protein